ncbi:hypothetical protein C5167_048630 [Papaver somniferum]|uniref:Uncharacterized protein n=1 Tax=Papaver somniferum TaxID=3469 RepID=A0A4Y7KLE0_PAPSO|nr:hypothetical protein C5167_048630 [Papaver somniferum]
MKWLRRTIFISRWSCDTCKAQDQSSPLTSDQIIIVSMRHLVPSFLQIREGSQLRIKMLSSFPSNEVHRRIAKVWKGSFLSVFRQGKLCLFGSFACKSD